MWYWEELKVSTWGPRSSDSEPKRVGPEGEKRKIRCVKELKVEHYGLTLGELQSIYSEECGEALPSSPEPTTTIGDKEPKATTSWDDLCARLGNGKLTWGDRWEAAAAIRELEARAERAEEAHIFADAARDAADAKLAEVEKERDDWIEITARTEDALRRRTRQLADADAKAEAAEATIATLTEKVEAMRRALKYYKDTFCEGFCGEDCWSDEGHSHSDLQRDCSGCLAASVLIRAARTTENQTNG